MGGAEGGRVGARLCPENGRTMRPYWIIPTSLARVERPVRISIKNFKLQARFRARAAPSVPMSPHGERRPSRDAGRRRRAEDYRMPLVIRMQWCS